MKASEIKLASRAARLDKRPLLKRVGLIILATDHTTEVDFQRIVASDTIGVYSTRIPYANPTTPDNLRAMQPSLTAAAALILPDEELDVVMYSCTSASVVIGDDQVKAAIKLAKPSAAVVTPTAASAAALKAVQAKRISILTPYTVEISRPMATYFLDIGFDIDRFTCIGLSDDREMARISPADIVAFAREAMGPESDALFISCTAVRAACVAADIEQAIGKPVVTSNLATAWACLRLCNVELSPPRGHLFTPSYRLPSKA
ncbi:ectoine utilization protein EutA [Sinorhizobium arboris]|uniref:ectoine utilization protein EutA n=1 Tax=Sinorhizobium arboris TaxID=76745 RepID=UPI00047FFDA0|nr:ectoine utilization protein EutA [Sinorhizobium arboris]